MELFLKDIHTLGYYLFYLAKPFHKEGEYVIDMAFSSGYQQYAHTVCTHFLILPGRDYNPQFIRLGNSKCQ